MCSGGMISLCWNWYKC